MAPRGDRGGETSTEPLADAPIGVRALLDRVVGPAPFGFALYDTDLRYVMINALLARLNGLPPADHVGRRVYDVIPDLADQVVASLEQVLASGEPIIDTEVVGETPGEAGRLGVWLNSFYRITADDGELLGVAAITRDVTEERRMQAQLATEQFRAAFDASLEPAVMVAARPRPGRDDLELWIDYLNPAAAEDTGLTPPEAVGRRLVDVFPSVLDLDLEPAYRRVYETGEPYVARRLPFTDVRSGEPTPSSFDLSATRTPGGLLIAWRYGELEHRLIEQRAALTAERTRVSQLQRSFLPRRLPTLPGACLAARYRSAERDAPLGGDWYDALAIDDRLVVCIGDVAGHGMEAVETMGVARVTARAYLAEDPRPEVVLARLDRYAQRMTADAPVRPLMTMVAAAYDPATRTLTWSNAGHPPPMVVDGAGARLLDCPPRPPLGLASGRFPAHAVTLAPGSLIVLYTDGLVERRGETIDDGLDRLLGATADLPPDPGLVCDLLLNRCIDPQAHDDDVCLVVVRTT